MRSFDAFESISLVAGQEASSTPCRVHVKPEAVLVADVGDRENGIECPDDRRSLRAVDEVRFVTEFESLNDQSLQLRGNHATPAHVFVGCGVLWVDEKERRKRMRQGQGNRRHKLLACHRRELRRRSQSPDQRSLLRLLSNNDSEDGDCFTRRANECNLVTTARTAATARPSHRQADHDWDALTCSDVKSTSWGKLFSPFSL